MGHAKHNGIRTTEMEKPVNDERVKFYVTYTVMMEVRSNTLEDAMAQSYDDIRLALCHIDQAVVRAHFHSATPDWHKAYGDWKKLTWS